MFLMSAELPTLQIAYLQCPEKPHAMNPCVCGFLFASPFFMSKTHKKLQEMIRQWVWNEGMRCIMSEYGTCRVRTHKECVDTSIIIIL
jgi:hypothetical protein